MTITSGANAKICTMKCQIQDELLFWLHFRFITAIDCALSLAVISTANLQWDLQHSQKLYSVQPKYLQCKF